MDSKKLEFIGKACGHHGTYTFYKAFKYFAEGKTRILSLGEFFYLKILDDFPVCIGELQLLWEDKNNNSQLLSSVRIYFLPKDTETGKQYHHGEHEVLASGEKVVLRLEDLVNLIIVNHVTWDVGLQVCADEDVKEDKTNNNLRQTFNTNNKGLQFHDVQKEKESIGNNEVLLSTEVIILSYPAYCRLRMVLKRLENVTDKWLKNTLVCALGGFTTRSQDARIMFCRDFYDIPELEDLEIWCDHLAPKLQGRPRKRKSVSSSSSKDPPYMDESTSSGSSDESTETSIAQAVKAKIGKRTGLNGIKLERERISRDEQQFLLSLHKFMRDRNTPIEKIPSLGFKQIDLYCFFNSAQKLGGYENLSQKRLWKHLYDKLGGHPGSTSAATCTRRHYERLLLAYEKHVRGKAHHKNKAKSSQNNRLSTRRKEEPALHRHPVRETRSSTEKLSPVEKPQPQEKRASVEKQVDKPKVETEQLNSVKRRLSATLNLKEQEKEKEKKWEELRKKNALERDKARLLTTKQTVKEVVEQVKAKTSPEPVKSNSTSVTLQNSESTMKEKVQQNTKVKVTESETIKMSLPSNISEMSVPKQLVSSNAPSIPNSPPKTTPSPTIPNIPIPFHKAPLSESVTSPPVSGSPQDTLPVINPLFFPPHLPMMPYHPYQLRMSGPFSMSNSLSQNMPAMHSFKLPYTSSSSIAHRSTEKLGTCKTTITSEEKQFKQKPVLMENIAHPTVSNSLSSSTVKQQKRSYPYSKESPFVPSFFQPSNSDSKRPKIDIRVTSPTSVFSDPHDYRLLSPANIVASSSDQPEDLSLKRSKQKHSSQDKSQTGLNRWTSPEHHHDERKRMFKYNNLTTSSQNKNSGADPRRRTKLFDLSPTSSVSPVPLPSSISASAKKSIYAATTSGSKTSSIFPPLSLLGNSCEESSLLFGKMEEQEPGEIIRESSSRNSSHSSIPGAIHPAFSYPSLQPQLFPSALLPAYQLQQLYGMHAAAALSGSALPTMTSEKPPGGLSPQLMIPSLPASMQNLQSKQNYVKSFRQFNPLSLVSGKSTH